ncbi:hypothetical protein C8Q77DRAFT_684705 [Trametes polyzona]|nr:hypothetical protein C8Q77DRAFT_684705 [Trametes polyzona]
MACGALAGVAQVYGSRQTSHCDDGWTSSIASLRACATVGVAQKASQRAPAVEWGKAEQAEREVRVVLSQKPSRRRRAAHMRQVLPPSSPSEPVHGYPLVSPLLSLQSPYRHNGISGTYASPRSTAAKSARVHLGRAVVSGFREMGQVAYPGTRIHRSRGD